MLYDRWVTTVPFKTIKSNTRNRSFLVLSDSTIISPSSSVSFWYFAGLSRSGRSSCGTNEISKWRSIKKQAGPLGVMVLSSMYRTPATFSITKYSSDVRLCRWFCSKRTGNVPGKPSILAWSRFRIRDWSTLRNPGSIGTPNSRGICAVEEVFGVMLMFKGCECEESAGAGCVIYTGESVAKRSVDGARMARST